MTYILHQQLVELSSQAKAWLSGEHASSFRASTGICNNIELDSADFTVLCDLMQRWPGGSGDKDYPVLHPNENPANAYINARTQEMWDPRHEYARNRWMLLEWLIEQTAPQTERTS